MALNFPPKADVDIKLMHVRQLFNFVTVIYFLTEPTLGGGLQMTILIKTMCIWAQKNEGGL